jgi:hypothetical protein
MAKNDIGPYNLIYYHIYYLFWRYSKRNPLVNSLDIQVIHIRYHITTTKYKNFKMINLIHTISILNSSFFIVLYVKR